MEGPFYKEVICYRSPPLSTRSVNFSKQVSRDKVGYKTPGAHEKRFTLPDSYDKSRFLTSNKRALLVLSFDNQL